MSQTDENQVTNDEVADIASQLELEPEVGTPETPVEGDKPAPAKEGPKAPEAAKTPEGEKSPEEASPEAKKPEGEENPEAPKPEEKKPAGESPDDEAARKERNRQFYEQRQQERQSQRRQIEQTIDEAYKPQSADELTQKFIDQGYDEFQAKMLADNERRDQQVQINSDRTAVAELNMQIETEAVQVMHECPVYDPKSEEYDKAFADKASALYNQASGEVVDPKTKLVIRTNITPYKFFKELAEMRSSGVSQAEVKGQQAAQQQMAAVAPTTSTAPVVHENTEDKQAAALEAAMDAVR